MSRIPFTWRLTSVRFCLKPCDLCIIVLVLHSVYCKLSLCLSNCSQGNMLSLHATILLHLKAATLLKTWTIPTNCPALTLNSRSPRHLCAQACWILFHRQTCSTQQTDRACSCTHTHNNETLVLGQNRSAPLFWGRGNVSMWSNILEFFCMRMILYDLSLNGFDHFLSSGSHIRVDAAWNQLNRNYL